MTQFQYTNHSAFHKNKSMLIVNPGVHAGDKFIEYYHLVN